MKNKIAIASAFLAAASFSTAEIVINDFLSFEGFVDMSYSHTDNDTDSRTNAFDSDESDNNYAVDQVEISWLFDFDPVTAQIDLQYEGDSNEGDDEDGELVEQAFVTYHFAGEHEGVAITAGRYASMLGFEAFEPTGLYQYSLAYDINRLDFDALPGDSEVVTDVSIIPGYAQGVKLTHEGDTTFFGISLQDEIFDNDGDRLNGDNDASYGIEAAASIMIDNGITLFLGGAYEDADAGDSYVINAYATLETGAWLFAAELNYGESESNAFTIGQVANTVGFGIDDVLGVNNVIDDEEVLQALLMANFAYSEQASVTGRVSYGDHVFKNGSGNRDATLEFTKVTLAHNYAFTDNLLLVTEVSFIDGETEGDTVNDDADIESFIAAVELLFTF